MSVAEGAPEPDLAAELAATGWRGAWRRQQIGALNALEQAWGSGARRASVVLPPGAGKTLVGLEAARRLGRRTIVLGPNTAIQGQWIRAWRGFAPATVIAGTDPDLSATVTALTYQALAVFDPDTEVDEDGRDMVARERLPRAQRPGSLLDRLHPHGQALVAALRDAGALTLVLDECHHLLEVWGRLLDELLALLPDAYVIALTATPPATLRSDQAELVRSLFGDPVYTTSIPAVVRDGHLAPFAELAWLTTPTAAEHDWLAEQATRFRELTTDLTHPDFATRGFLDHLDARFVKRSSRTPGSLPVSWARLEKDHPDLAAAALRFHHAGLLAMPVGARIREEHRHPPAAADWVALIGDYVTTFLARSGDERDKVAYQRLRTALPAVGYQLTRRGVRAGRSPVDRVLARSEAKMDAAVEISAAEHACLGERARILVLADHEKAVATLPATLAGVLSTEAGSARLALERLAADPRTAALHPMLVTGSTVAAARVTARAFVAFARTRRADLRLQDIEPPDRLSTTAVAGLDPDVVEVCGSWTPRSWVPLVTEFFEAGHTQALVGTRGLLGEGWDARRVNVLIDLTTATTATAVVQTRGRALRIDPDWPDKVANTWSVVTVTDAHPNGAADWDRLARKHASYLALDADGAISDGVTHLHPDFSPYAPPPVDTFDALNVTMLARAENRAAVREGWRIGIAYTDTLEHTVRVVRRRPGRDDEIVRAGARQPVTPLLLPGPRGLVRQPGCPNPSRLEITDVLPAAGTGVLVYLPGAPWPVVSAAALGALALTRSWVKTTRAARLLAAADPDPGVLPFACAVADGLHRAKLVPYGAEAVEVDVDANGVYRIRLAGVAPDASAVFAAALDDVLSPIAAPRYVIARYLAPRPGSGMSTRRFVRAWRSNRGAAAAVVYHAVPGALGGNAARAKVFAAAWSRWVSLASPVRTTSPEGEGIMVTHRGADPFDATTALRAAWH